MLSKGNNIANRVLLAGAIAFVTILVLFGVGVALANYNPGGRAFISLKMFLGVVFIAVFIGDRVYVKKHRT